MGWQIPCSFSFFSKFHEAFATYLGLSPSCFHASLSHPSILPCDRCTVSIFIHPLIPVADSYPFPFSFTGSRNKNLIILPIGNKYPNLCTHNLKLFFLCSVLIQMPLSTISATDTTGNISNGCAVWGQCDKVSRAHLQLFPSSGTQCYSPEATRRALWSD